MSSPFDYDPLDSHPWTVSEPSAAETPEIPVIAANEAQASEGEAEQPLFQSYLEPEYDPPARIPNFGHLGVLSVLLGISLLCTALLTRVALAHRLFGVSTAQKAITDIHYTLGTEGVLYLFTLVACMIVFPMIWGKGLFAGLQWNFATAVRLRWRLISISFACFLLALLNGLLIPGPSNAPIDKIFHAPGAAWVLFGFGVTFAPLFEEMAFRGFLLPALCTAVDWFREENAHRHAPPLGENGHPQWSRGAMITGSIATSIPFALLHAQQTGWSIGPFMLLLGVSLVLCTVRLLTRSLASSVMVHACYNFLLFSIMLLGTSGFQHLDKM